MHFVSKIKALARKKEVRNNSINFLADVASAVMGNKVAAAKVMVAICKVPGFYKGFRFWEKLADFINGVFVSDEDRARLSAILTEDGTNGENPHRLAECIDRAETKQKIRYLVNATRCLLADFIDLSDYFRICHAITQTLDEDLKFLKIHIKEADLPYDLCVQGLLTSGLMYQSVIDGDGDQKYSFTPIAELVDRYAVSYEDDTRYPNPISSTSNYNRPQVSLPSYEWEEITAEEVTKMFEDKI